MPTCNVRLRREARSVLTNGQVGAAEDRNGEGVMEDVTSARGPEPLRTCAKWRTEGPFLRMRLNQCMVWADFEIYLT